MVVAFGSCRASDEACAEKVEGIPLGLGNLGFSITTG